MNYTPPTGTVAATNTHHYDGSLPKDSELGVILRSRRLQGTSSEKLRLVSDFVSNISTQRIPENNPISMQYLTTTLRSWGLQPNIDGTNDVTADELLLICAEIWNNISKTEIDLIESFAKEFFAQFMDMQTGPCPQGRTVRLWQIASSYISWHKIDNM